MEAEEPRLNLELRLQYSSYNHYPYIANIKIHAFCKDCNIEVTLINANMFEVNNIYRYKCQKCNKVIAYIKHFPIEIEENKKLSLTKNKAYNKDYKE